MTERQPDPRAQLRGRRNKMVGAAVEAAVAEYLRYLGLLHVCPIETGMRKIGGKWMHCRNVAGDIRALLPGGRSVLVEVKKRDDVLQWSDLRDVQVRNLDEHARAGGLSLIAWRHARGISVLRWRPIGFDGPRCSITPDAAIVQALQPRFWIPNYASTSAAEGFPTALQRAADIHRNHR